MKENGYEMKRYGYPVKRYCQTMDLKDDPEDVYKRQLLDCSTEVPANNLKV